MISNLSEIEEALREAKLELTCLSADIGDCDHSINLCRCRIDLTLRQIKIVLEELVECPVCHNNTMYAPYSVASCSNCKGEGYMEVAVDYGQGMELEVEEA